MASVTQSKYLSSEQQHLVAGVRSILGVWVLEASYNRVDQKGTDAAGTSIAANDASQFALGADYLLSKRSAIYANAARLTNQGAARFAVPGGPLAVGAGTRSTGLDVGIRHSF